MSKLVIYCARFHEGLYARGLLESLLVLEWGYAPSLPPEGGGYSHSRSIIEVEKPFHDGGGQHEN